ncbi:MAG: hypothetical protein WC627_07765 [Legionella sp.]
MQVKDILIFSTDLGKAPDSTKNDKELGTILYNRYQSQDPEKTLNQEDFKYIAIWFNNRWDHTLKHSPNSPESNLLCMEFIKKLATAANKTCVDFLKQPTLHQYEFSHTVNNSISMPVFFINQLDILINSYKQLKAAKSDFNNFRQAAEEFLSCIEQVDLNSTMQIYNSRINNNKSYAFFIFYLLDIKKANDFTIDKEIEDLSNWVEKYIQCLRFIISSITTKFEIGFFDNAYVHIWDQCNNVTDEQAALISLIYPAIKANNLSELQETYERIVSRITVHDSSKYAGFFPLIWRPKSINTWMKHVKDQTLASTGVECYPPEVYLKVLVDFKKEAKLINEFLDDFIHTIITRENDLLKYIRMHCLFNTLLRKLQTSTRSELLAELKQVSFYQAQLERISNWVKLINNRILDIGGVSELTAEQHYTITNNTHYLYAISQGADIKRTADTDKIKGDPNDPVFKKVWLYLFDLEDSIQTQEHKIAMNRWAEASGPSDYFDYD